MPGDSSNIGDLGYGARLRRENIDTFDIDTPIGIPSPLKPTPFSAAIGDHGTGAILGFDHDLLQFSSYANRSLRFARGYSIYDQLEPLLAHTQNDENNEPNLGWGLRLHGTGHTFQTVERGFMDCRWPTQKKLTDKQAMGKKATTYVKDGKLVQAIAVASRAEVDIRWTIGGKIQLAMVDQNSIALDTDYSVDARCGGRILSARGNQCCIDIQLFIDGVPQDLGQSRAQPEHSGNQLNDFADVSCTGSLTLPDAYAETRAKILVAVFTLRASEPDREPEYIQGPLWSEVKERLSLKKGRRDVLPVDIWRNSKVDDQLPQLPHIILRNVEQLLSAVALPDSAPPELYKVRLMNGLVRIALPEINYEATFWHVRFLTRVLDEIEYKSSQHKCRLNELKEITRLAKGAENQDRAEERKTEKEVDLLTKLINSNNSYCVRIYDVIAGTIRKLFTVKSDIDPTLADRAFRMLTLFYTLRHRGGPQVAKLLLDISDHDDIQDGLEELKDTESGYSNSCLLMWCYGRVILDKGFGTSFSSFVSRYKPETDELQMYEVGALVRPNAAGETPYERINREEKWTQLALLQAELFASVEDTKPFVSKLVSEASKRLKERQSSQLGDSQPWGYRCLDHSLRIDLAIAKFNVLNQSKNLQETIQDAYNDCESFLRSDHSFLRSWDTTDPSWISEHWDLDCSSIVSSSLLSIVTLDWSRVLPSSTDTSEVTESSSTDTKLDEILHIMRDISEPERKQVKFPWRQNLRVGYPYYPQFMQASIESLKACLDSRPITQRVHKLRSRNSSNPLVGKPFEDLSPDQLSSDTLQRKDFNMCIFDFPNPGHGDFPQPGPVSGVWAAQLLADSRVARNTKYRTIFVDRLPTERLVNYITFAHSDAWDTVVDYFGLTPAFRGSGEGHQILDTPEGLTWNTSITIPHFMLLPGQLNSPHDFSQAFKFSHSSASTLKILHACISICMTGDKLGEFWTCSVIGENTPQHDTSDTNPPKPDAGILEKYKYDKFSARNLIFILQLTTACDAICERYEKILDELKATIGLETSKGLYEPIATTIGSKYIRKAMTRVTDALQMVLLGLECLENFDTTLRLTFPVIEKATAYTQTNLSKRRKYWQEELEGFEETIWEEYLGSYARLEACKNRIGDFTRDANGVKDNLIFLSNMATTQGILASTDDSSSMKVISILTAVFLPFTFMAVMLTTPMFKWPDPSEGHIIVNLPFIIWWVASIGMSLILVYVMWRLGTLQTEGSGEDSASGGNNASGSDNGSRDDNVPKRINRLKGNNASGALNASENNRTEQIPLWKLWKISKRRRRAISGIPLDLEVQVEHELPKD